MAKTVTEAHKRHTKRRPYSWPWDRPYVPSQFGGPGLPDFDIDFILARSKHQAAKDEDCPDKSAVLKYVEEACAALATGRMREAARAAYIVGFFDGRLAIAVDAALGKERRETFEEQNANVPNERRRRGRELRQRILGMLEERCNPSRSHGQMSFTDAVRDIRDELKAEGERIGRDRIASLLRQTAIEKRYLQPRPRKKKS